MTVALATSSYRQFDPLMGVPIRISVGRPRFPLGYDLGEHIPELCPTWAMLKMSPEEYDERFFGKLEKVGVERLQSIFGAIADRHGGARLVLLCFEDVLAGQTCHRRGFAAWWLERTGQRVPEIDPETGEMTLPPFRG